MWIGQIQGGVSIYVCKKHRSQRQKNKIKNMRDDGEAPINTEPAQIIKKGPSKKNKSKIVHNAVKCHFLQWYHFSMYIHITNKMCMYCHSEVILLATVEKPASDYSPSNLPSTNDPSCTLAVGVKLLCQRYYRWQGCWIQTDAWPRLVLGDKTWELDQPVRQTHVWTPCQLGIGHSILL